MDDEYFKNKMYLGKDRKLNRWIGYDYNQSGYYFVTLCVKNRMECLGKVDDGKTILNYTGEIVLKYWKEIPKHYKNVELDEFQIMPNHSHGIILIKPADYGAGRVGTEYYSVPTKTDSNNSPAPFETRQAHKKHGLISKIVKSFKHAVTKEIRQKYYDYNFAWQRSYHDRVIRDEKELINIREYIKNNPINWLLDRNNPNNIKST